MRMRVMAILAGLGVVLLAGCGANDRSSVDDALRRQADLHQIAEVQKTFHKALSRKDIDLMMGIWASNGTFTQGPGTTWVGPDEIRRAWLTSMPFQPTTHWVSETPGYKARATVNGDKGTLYFECHFVDVATKKLAAVVAADWHLARIDGRWLITTFVGTTATLSP